MSQRDYTYDPQAIFSELERASEEWSEAEALADQMDNMKKIILATIAQEGMETKGRSKTAAFDLAPADPRYKTHIDGLYVSKKRALRSRSYLQNLRALSDARRTQESSVRAQTNPRGY